MYITLRKHFLDMVQNRLRANQVFTVARRNLEGQEMLYQSIKLVNNIWVLAELKMLPGANSLTVCISLISCIIFIIHVSYFALTLCFLKWKMGEQQNSLDKTMQTLFNQLIFHHVQFVLFELNFVLNEFELFYFN